MKNFKWFFTSVFVYLRCEMVFLKVDWRCLQRVSIIPAISLFIEKLFAVGYALDMTSSLEKYDYSFRSLPRLTKKPAL